MLLNQVLRLVNEKVGVMRKDDLLSRNEIFLKICYLAAAGHIEWSKYDNLMRYLAKFICETSDEELEFILQTFPKFKSLLWPSDALQAINLRLDQRRISNNSPLLFTLDGGNIFDPFNNPNLEILPKSNFQIPDNFLSIENWPLKIDYFKNAMGIGFLSSMDYKSYLSFQTGFCSLRDEMTYKFITEFVFYQDDPKCLQTAVIMAIGKEFQHLSSEDERSIIFDKLKFGFPDMFVGKRAIIAFLLMSVEGVPVAEIISKYGKELKSSFEDDWIVNLFLDKMEECTSSTETKSFFITFLLDNGILGHVQLYQYLLQAYSKGQEVSYFDFALNGDWIVKRIERLVEFKPEVQGEFIVMLVKFFIWIDVGLQEFLPIFIDQFDHFSIERLAQEAESLRMDALNEGKVIHPRMDFILRQLSKEHSESLGFIEGAELFEDDIYASQIESPIILADLLPLQKKAVTFKNLVVLEMEDLGHFMLGDILNNDKFDFDDFGAMGMPLYIDVSVMTVISEYINHCREHGHSQTNVPFTAIRIDIFLEIILAADYLDLTSTDRT